MTALKMIALLYFLAGYAGALGYMVAWQLSDVWDLIRGRKRDMSLRETLRLFRTAGVFVVAWPLVIYRHLTS